MAGGEVEAPLAVEASCTIIPAVMRRTHVDWFTSWSDTIGDAIDHLPHVATCPPDLYRSLLHQRCSTEYPVAVVSEPGRPIAVIGLRLVGFRRWEVRTHSLTPGFVCAAAPGDIIPSIARLRREVSVFWWRMPPLPSHGTIRRRETIPVHQLAISEREVYWRKSKQWQNVTAARRKCADLHISINEPGDAAWVIRSSDRKWRNDDRQTASNDDRIEIARYLESSGVHVTMVLRQGEKRVAGSTNIVHGDTMTAGVLYRDESVGSLPTGVRLIDEMFDLAEQRGLHAFDLGGGHGYKSRWAPESGVRDEFVQATTPEYQIRSGLVRVQRALQGRTGKKKPSKQTEEIRAGQK